MTGKEEPWHTKEEATFWVMHDLQSIDIIKFEGRG